MNKTCLLICLLATSLYTTAQPLPSKSQLAWHDQEFYLFVHFGPNTFTDKEWGLGDEPAAVFNPSQLDCRQWARVAKRAGAKGIIITAKHHDGFCLWPSRYSKHTVRESKWKNGKGDVLKELSIACKEYGLKFGVYISPWDRNHPKYGTDEYNDVFVNMMKELFSSYGPIWELWWDGANGEGPNGKKQAYDWKRFERTVRELSPSTVIFSDIGPDIRWVGNEKGFAGETNWNYLDTAGFTRGIGAPPTDTLNQGNINGKNWIPAECDVSIRPGWFYHANEDDKVKTPEQLFDLYCKSVGRGANLLLNVPPDARGLMHENDSASLAGFNDLLQKNLSMNQSVYGKGYMVLDKGNTPVTVLNDLNDTTSEEIPLEFHEAIGITFEESRLINCVVLKEDIRYGQGCKEYIVLLISKEDEILKLIKGTTIGKKRIVLFDDTRASKVVLLIDTQRSSTHISEIETYLVDKNLTGSKN
jgi:alpha-L-fucosidase